MSAMAYPKLAQACSEGGMPFPQHLAEAHPRIIDRIETSWGTHDCASQLASYVFSDRPDRSGFSFEVLRELFMLKELHEANFPHLSFSPNDPFAATMAEVVRADVDRRREAAKKPLGSAVDRRPLKQIPISMQKEGALAAAGPSPAAAPAAEAVRAAEPTTKATTELPKAAAPVHTPWPEVSSLNELRAIVERREKGERLPPRDTRPTLEILRQYLGLRDEDIEAALKVQKQIGKKAGPIGQVLLSMGVIEAEHITRVLCLQYGVLMVDLKRFQILPEVMRKVPIEVSRKHRAVPIALLGGTLFLAVENPFDFAEREYFAFLAKSKVELVMTAATQISQWLAEYGTVRSVRQGAQEFDAMAQKALGKSPEELATALQAEEEEEDKSTISQNDSSIVSLVNKILSDAAEIGASDIHIECFPGEPLARIRFRRDGRLEDYSQYSASYHRAVVSRIKIMAALDIAERRLPQDGKISFVRADRRRLDLRVATIPTTRGIENVTIRLLASNEPIPLTKLQMSSRDLEVFQRLLAKPYGLLLVCGPTGSGKTTTLHSALAELNRPENKIWTAEDPIEIVQKNICQVQVNPEIGWTFAKALRSFLRADPDIIMIGEMRDAETAGIAVEASMTGYLVLSTLHTNSAAETAARLLDLGVDPFNLSDALIGVLAQRLTRRLCPHCRQRTETSQAELEELAAEYVYSAEDHMPSKQEKEAIIAEWQKRLGAGAPVALWHAQGCQQCNREGYRGRVAVFELMEVSPRIRSAIAHRASAVEIQKLAIAEGMHTLKQDGIEKALLGLTDMREVRAVCA